jgi:chromosome segregation ATPase
LIQDREVKAANTALNEYRAKLDKANAAIAELSKELNTAQADLGKRNSQLQALEAELKDAKQTADQAKAEAAENEKQIVRLNQEVALERQAEDQAKAEMAEREKQIAKLRQGIASSEEFFNEWEVRGAPASISAIAALGREAAAAKDCIDKGDVATACKHWQGLLVEIEKMGPPLSESRGDIEELMRQNRCEAEGNAHIKLEHSAPATCRTSGALERSSDHVRSWHVCDLHSFSQLVRNPLQSGSLSASTRRIRDRRD